MLTVKPRGSVATDGIECWSAQSVASLVTKCPYPRRTSGLGDGRHSAHVIVIRVVTKALVVAVVGAVLVPIV